MRFAVAALLLFAGGCFVEEPPRPRRPVEHYSLPPPKVRRVEMSQVDFHSAAAKHALHSVEYRDCGRGGAGRVVIVFNAAGNVIRSSVVDARYTEEAESCVLARFHVVHVPSFTSETEHAVSFRIWLPQPYEAPPDDGEPYTDDQQRDESPVPTSM